MLLPAAGAVAADAPVKPATPDPVLVQVVAGDWRRVNGTRPLPTGLPAIVVLTYWFTVVLLGRRSRH